MFIWVYRLIVFVGIAVFVYHFFFKALGIVLFAVEIVWFVGLPIVSELKHWLAKRKQIVRSRRSKWLLGILLLLFVAAVVPLPRFVRVEGLLSSAEEFRVIAPETAMLAELHVRDGEKLKQGDPLLRLESPLLRFRAARARLKVDTLKMELAAASGNMSQRPRVSILEAQLATASAALREAEAAVRQLTPSAPFSGRFHFAEPDLRVGEEIGANEALGVLAGDGGWSVSCYIDEQSAHLVKVGSRARIYLGPGSDQTLRLRVVAIDQDASRTIAEPLLSTDGGGAVAVRVSGAELVPLRAVYRVYLAVDGPVPPDTLRATRGPVVISGEAEAWVVRWSRTAIAVLWRELGF